MSILIFKSVKHEIKLLFLITMFIYLLKESRVWNQHMDAYGEVGNGFRCVANSSFCLYSMVYIIYIYIYNKDAILNFLKCETNYKNGGHPLCSKVSYAFPLSSPPCSHRTLRRLPSGRSIFKSYPSIAFHNSPPRHHIILFNLITEFFNLIAERICFCAR